MKQHVQIGYVVLHYQNGKVTTSCINSLLKTSTDAPIVVVDNASPNSSGKQLMNIFQNEKRITIILNTKNVGFARGNNLGFQYLKQNYDIDNIVVINNDVIIDSSDFEKQIISYMQQNKIDVCGPDILTPALKHQNPLLPHIVTTKKLIVQIVADEMRMLLLRLKLFEKRIYAFYNRSSASHHKTTVATNGILHGACIVYGRRYVQSEQYAFLPLTFLYAEEMLLADFLKHKKYSTSICTTTSVTHLGGVSTAIGMNEKEKLIFKTHQMNKSLCIVLWQRLKYLFS